MSGGAPCDIKTYMLEEPDRHFILVTGGARSGKSSYALTRGEALGDRRMFVATGRATDPEMEERIRKHREARGELWHTIEEPRDLAATILKLKGECDVVLVDCLGFWIANLMESPDFGETALDDELDRLEEAINRRNFHMIVVTNEVGMGIVPENELARRFRDLLGMANQRMANLADTVIMMISGLPVMIKGAADSAL